MALYFPAFKLTTERKLDIAERTLVLVIKVKSTSHPKAVLSFDFEAEAMFQCAEFEQTEEALQQFASGTTPMMLVWAYVRSYMALQMTQLGLPPYHLPLVLRWNEVPDEPTEVEATPSSGQ